MQLGASDARHGRVAVGPRRDRVVVVGGPVELDIGGARVTGGGEHGHPVGGGVEVGGAQVQQRLRRREGLLGGAEALADHAAQVVVDHVLLRRHDLGEACGPFVLRGRGLYQQDGGTGRHRVGVLHVECRLPGPPLAIGIRRIGRDFPCRLDHRERRRSRQLERGIEDAQVALDGRGTEGVDDDDRLAPARDGLSVEGRHVVGLAHLEGRVARDTENSLALGGGVGRRGGPAGVNRVRVQDDGVWRYGGLDGGRGEGRANSRSCRSSGKDGQRSGGGGKSRRHGRGGLAERVPLHRSPPALGASRSVPGHGNSPVAHPRGRPGRVAHARLGPGSRQGAATRLAASSARRPPACRRHLGSRRSCSVSAARRRCSAGSQEL